jgi:PhnB protein
MPAKPIPDGYHSVTPYLYVSGAADALEFWKKAFGTTELLRMPGPNGTLSHAEVKIGNSIIMFADEHPDFGNKSPKTLGGVSGGFMIYTEDADAMFAKAVAAGATVFRPLADQFYGDRSGTVTDPFGHVWTIATHKEDLTPAQIDERFAAWMASQKK